MKYLIIILALFSTPGWADLHVYNDSNSTAMITVGYGIDQQLLKDFRKTHEEIQKNCANFKRDRKVWLQRYEKFVSDTLTEWEAEHRALYGKTFVLNSAYTATSTIKIPPAIHVPADKHEQNCRDLKQEIKIRIRECKRHTQPGMDMLPSIKELLDVISETLDYFEWCGGGQ